MTLSEEEIYEVILWLLDQYDFEDCGRTDLMVRAFVEIGVNNPGRPVYFFARRPFAPNRRMMGNTIHQMLKRDHRVENFVWFADHFIITKRKETLCA